jgi:hypothetical protein
MTPRPVFLSHVLQRRWPNLSCRGPRYSKKFRKKKINLVVAQGIERSSEMKKVAGAPGRGIYIHDE